MSTPIPTAGRNVAWRIEQLLRAQEAMPTLTNWQAETVMAATTAVDEERFADGEADMMKAERPDLWQGGDSAPATRVEVEQLVALLKNAAAT